MGGTGSTRWNGHIKADTVEDSYKLSIDVLGDYLSREVLLSGGAQSGVLTWKRGESEKGSIGYTFTHRGGRRVLTVNFTRYGQSLTTSLPMQTSIMPSGGVRFWLTCPTCDRRVRCVYLPPGGRAFACRHCYKLTYTSCQESHQFDAMRRWIDALLAKQAAGRAY